MKITHLIATGLLLAGIGGGTAATAQSYGGGYQSYDGGYQDRDRYLGDRDGFRDYRDSDRDRDGYRDGDRDRGDYRDRDRDGRWDRHDRRWNNGHHYGWRNRHCWTEWRHHHRVRVCR